MLKYSYEIDGGMGYGGHGYAGRGSGESRSVMSEGGLPLGLGPRDIESSTRLLCRRLAVYLDQRSVRRIGQKQKQRSLSVCSLAW